MQTQTDGDTYANYHISLMCIQLLRTLKQKHVLIWSLIRISATAQMTLCIDRIITVHTVRYSHLTLLAPVTLWITSRYSGIPGSKS